MTTIHSRHTRALLVGTAALMLALIGSAAGASELHGQQTVSNRQKLEQARSTDGQPIPTTAVADGHYTVETGASPASDSTLTIGGNHQSAEIAGNVAATRLTATAVHAEGGGTYEPTPFAVLSNHQTGDGTVEATSRMTIAVPGEIRGSSVTLSGNTDSALARMNDASNVMSVDTVHSSGGIVLVNAQHAAGQVTATASNRIDAGNGGSPILSSRQTVEGNTAASQARGNNAENRMTVSGGTGNGDHPGGGETPMLARADQVMPMAGAILASRQVNTGGVAARTDIGVGVALNCGCAGDSRIGVADTAGSAIAYGNAGFNAATVTGNAQPLALVSNMQVNRGPVSATVNGQFGVSPMSGITGSMVAITGNGLSAIAVGNQAANTISAMR